MKKQIKEKLKSSCAESERKQRVESVSKILEGVKYKTPEEKEWAILSFAKSSLSEEQIERVVAPGKPNYMTDQLTKRGLY